MKQNRIIFSFLHFFIEMSNKIKFLLVVNGVRAEIRDRSTTSSVLEFLSLRFSANGVLNIGFN